MDHAIKYPLYVEKFSGIYAKIGNPGLSTESTDLLNKATWDFVLFAHAVKEKSYQNALILLRGVGTSLDVVIQELRYGHVPTPARDTLYYLRAFIAHLYKQYEKFYKRKIFVNKAN